MKTALDIDRYPALTRKLAVVAAKLKDIRARAHHGDEDARNFVLRFNLIYIPIKAALLTSVVWWIGPKAIVLAALMLLLP